MKSKRGRDFYSEGIEKRKRIAIDSPTVKKLKRREMERAALDRRPAKMTKPAGTLKKQIEKTKKKSKSKDTDPIIQIVNPNEFFKREAIRELNDLADRIVQEAMDAEELANEAFDEMDTDDLYPSSSASSSRTQDMPMLPRAPIKMKAKLKVKKKTKPKRKKPKPQPKPMRRRIML